MIRKVIELSKRAVFRPLLLVQRLSDPKQPIFTILTLLEIDWSYSEVLKTSQPKVRKTQSPKKNLNYLSIDFSNLKSPNNTLHPAKIPNQNTSIYILTQKTNTKQIPNWKGKIL